MSLQVVPPIQITDAMLISSTVPEADHAEWSSGDTYALGDRVMTVATHKVFESLQATNLNHPVTDLAWWVEVSPTNRWKCFDTSNSTRTAQANAIQYVIKPGQSVSSLALLNIFDTTSLRVQMTDPVRGLVYSKTVYVGGVLSDSSWYSFFIADKLSLSSAVITDLPNYPSATLTIDITGSTDMAFGVLMIGQAKAFGEGISYGAKVGIQDYSRKETNDFGDTILVQRAYAKRASFNVRLTARQTDIFNDWLASVRAVPCLWIGSSRYTSTMIFGIYQSFDTTIQYFDVSECSLEILGLT